MEANASAGTAKSRDWSTVILFAIYLLLLIALILFKFPFAYQASTGGRELNLVPYAGSFTERGAFRWSEVVENVLVFVPFGIYLSMLAPDWSVVTRLLPIVATTVVFEALQYSFNAGRADITDVLDNTLGGIAGIGLYVALARILGNRTNRIMRVGLAILTVVVLALCGFLLSRSLGSHVGPGRVSGESNPSTRGTPLAS